ncbi:MAG: hypothetical protein ACRDJM_08450 [Actinomycetota bacterium]
MLTVALEPLQNGLGRVRGDKHLQPPLGDPLPDEGSEKVRLATLVRSWPNREVRLGLAAPPPDRETKPAQDPTGLMRVEIGPVKARHQADHLFRRETLAGDHDIMIIEGVGEHISQQEFYLVLVEGKLLMRNHGLYLTHTYCIPLIESYYKPLDASGSWDV